MCQYCILVNTTRTIYTKKIISYYKNGNTKHHVIIIDYVTKKATILYNLVCNREQLKQLYTRVYKDRLKHRTERPEYSQMREQNEYLFNLRLKLSKTRVSANWTHSDMNTVMKKLKINKATDPAGLVSELFNQE
jgi:hypothetical protein